MVVINTSSKIPCPDILGVTISTPGYQDLAIQAAERFRKFSGCDTLILESNERNGFNLKLELHRIFANRDICFFDSDLWAVRKFDLTEFCNSSSVIGVNDPTSTSPASFCYHDSISLGIPFSKYLNTGFLICDFKSKKVRRSFEIARENINNKEALNVRDNTEQSILNYGFKNCKVKTIPLKWNFWKKAADWGNVDSIPRDIINVHAAGYTLPMKKEILERHSSVFGEEIQPEKNYSSYNVHKGYIISTLDQMDLAREAKRRAIKYANLHCEIIHANDKKHAHYLKLRVLQESVGPCYLLDNDIWFLNNTILPSPEENSVFACHCAGEAMVKRCKENGMDYNIYFNSGFVGIGSGSKIRIALQEAIILREISGNDMDEVFMNISFQRHRLDINIMTDRINWCANSNFPADVVAIHAARKSNKLDWLMQGVKNYESR
jgi:hypothetical protein